MNKNMTLILALSLLTTLLAIAPMTAAEDHEDDITYDWTHPGEAIVHINTTWTGDDAQDAARNADADNDGTVNASERADYEEAIRAFLGERGEDETQSTFDDSPPSHQTGLSVETTGLEGPVEQANEIQLHMVAKLAYPSTDEKSEHTFRRITQTDDDGLRIIIRAPPGYEIKDARGADDLTMTAEELSGVLDSRKDLVVTFAQPQEEEGDPAETGQASSDPPAPTSSEQDTRASSSEPGNPVSHAALAWTLGALVIASRARRA